jgi:hypothetical protein
MKRTALLLACIIAPIWAEVRITQLPDRISVEIDGKPFTSLFTGPEVVKPFLYPLRAVSGTSVTRSFPLEESPGDSKDHPHHRGLTFAHADLNGYNFWANESFNPGKKGKIVLKKVDRITSGRKTGVIVATFTWLDSAGAALMDDTRTITFHSDPKLRIIDYEVSMKPIQPVKFGDTHEGSFGVRVAAWLEEPAPKYIPKAGDGEARPTEPKRTGRITNSEGLQTEAQVRGKHANWADYSGEYRGEKLGIAMFDPPSNPRHPVLWHTRGYGMFAANMFAAKDLGNEKGADGSLALNPGQTLDVRYRVVIHPGDAESAGIAKLYSEYCKSAASASGSH